MRIARSVSVALFSALLISMLALPAASCAPAPPEADTTPTEIDFPVLSGPYLGQEPPGMVPELFAPGVVSTAGAEWSSSFTPDGMTFAFGYQGDPHGILLMREVDGHWTEPTLFPFSGEFRDFDLNFSPDGSMLLFTSTRPRVDEEGEREDSDLWVLEWLDDGRGMMRNFDEPVNSDGWDLYPSMTAGGTLYFFGDGRGESTTRTAFRSRFVLGQFTEPEPLGPTINTEEGVFDPFIAPDESFIIFASDRRHGLGEGDLYVAFRTEDGAWSEAVNLGSTINSPQTDFCPSITKDGKYLFFTSRRPYEGAYPRVRLSYREELPVRAENEPGNTDIYWVDARVIDALRPGGE